EVYGIRDPVLPPALLRVWPTASGSTRTCTRAADRARGGRTRCRDRSDDECCAARARARWASLPRAPAVRATKAASRSIRAKWPRRPWRSRHAHRCARRYTARHTADPDPGGPRGARRDRESGGRLSVRRPDESTSRPTARRRPPLVQSIVEVARQASDPAASRWQYFEGERRLQMQAANGACTTSAGG